MYYRKHELNRPKTDVCPNYQMVLLFICLYKAARRRQRMVASGTKFRHPSSTLICFIILRTNTLEKKTCQKNIFKCLSAFVIYFLPSKNLTRRPQKKVKRKKSYCCITFRTHPYISYAWAPISLPYHSNCLLITILSTILIGLLPYQIPREEIPYLDTFNTQQIQHKAHTQILINW